MPAPVAIPTRLMSLYRGTIFCTFEEGIECDVCDRPGPVVLCVGQDALAEARALAQLDGWCSDGDVDVCPACIARGN